MDSQEDFVFLGGMFNPITGSPQLLEEVPRGFNSPPVNWNQSPPPGDSMFPTGNNSPRLEVFPEGEAMIPAPLSPENPLARGSGSPSSTTIRFRAGDPSRSLVEQLLADASEAGRAERPPRSSSSSPSSSRPGRVPSSPATRGEPVPAAREARRQATVLDDGLWDRPRSVNVLNVIIAVATPEEIPDPLEFARAVMTFDKKTNRVSREEKRQVANLMKVLAKIISNMSDEKARESANSLSEAHRAIFDAARRDAGRGGEPKGTGRSARPVRFVPYLEATLDTLHNLHTSEAANEAYRATFYEGMQRMRAHRMHQPRVARSTGVSLAALIEDFSSDEELLEPNLDSPRTPPAMPTEEEVVLLSPVVSPVPSPGPSPAASPVPSRSPSPLRTEGHTPGSGKVKSPAISMIDADRLFEENGVQSYGIQASAFMYALQVEMRTGCSLEEATGRVMINLKEHKMYFYSLVLRARMVKMLEEAHVPPERALLAELLNVATLIALNVANEEYPGTQEEREMWVRNVTGMLVSRRLLSEDQASVVMHSIVRVAADGYRIGKAHAPHERSGTPLLGPGEHEREYPHDTLFRNIRKLKDALGVPLDMASAYGGLLCVIWNDPQEKDEMERTIAHVNNHLAIATEIK